MASSKKSKKASKPAKAPKSVDKMHETPQLPPRWQALAEEEEESSEHDSANSGCDYVSEEEDKAIDGDNEGGEEEEDSEEEVEIQVPHKRKPAPKTNTKSLSIVPSLPLSHHFLLEKAQKHADPTDHEAGGTDEELQDEIVPKISYTVTTLSLEELKKPATRRKAKSRLIELSSGLEWMDMHQENDLWS